MTTRPCPKCHGAGMRHYRIPLPFRTLFQYLQDVADGKDSPVMCTERRKCLDCDGTGALLVLEPQASA